MSAGNSLSLLLEVVQQSLLNPTLCGMEAVLYYYYYKTFIGSDCT